MKQNEPLFPVSLFELAPVFLKRGTNDLPEEKLRLTLATHRPADVILGHLRAMAKEWGIDVRVDMAEVDNLAGGKSGVVYSNKQTLGIIGQVSAEVMAGYGLRRPVWIADWDFDLVKKLAANTVSLQLPPKFSAIFEDITLILPPKTMVGPILEDLKLKSSLIQNVRIVGSWENTVTLRLEFNSTNKQLTQAEVNSEKEKIYGGVGVGVKVGVGVGEKFHS